jgi:tRNA-Thr(GGU) m(6)t(6)A37 methyltransferase TsaA
VVNETHSTVTVHFDSIGIIHSPFEDAQGTPIQPRAAEGVHGEVEVFSEFLEGLKDLDGFERIWLVYSFDRAVDLPSLIVHPYLDPTESHGVFATRAPARPNPIGISAVRLLGVRGNLLSVSDVDVLDGTPLLDIKPYVPQFDCFQVSRSGWMAGRTVEGAVADRRGTDRGHA